MLGETVNPKEWFDSFVPPAFELGPLALNLALTWAACSLLAAFYSRYGLALSDRRAFGATFAPLGMTTMLVISVVRSSLALSLGLVGALSIVRFRTAVKEPEELSYLFMVIAIGLGMGASQALLTLACMGAILAALWWRRRLSPSGRQPGYFIVVSGSLARCSVEAVLRTLQPHCSGLSLRRMDEAAQRREISLQAHFDSDAKVEAALKALKKMDSGCAISLLENKGELG